MTRPSTPADDEALPVGPDADEVVDEDALIDAGLPRDGSGQMVVPGSDRKVSLAHRLYNGEAGLDVVGHSKLIYRITAVVVLVCLLSMIFRGFNFGIDFEGGSSFRLPGESSQLTDVRAAAEGAGADVASAQVVGGNTILVRAGQLDNDGETAVIDAMAKAAGIDPKQVSPETVSAQWGSDITDQALIALAVF